MELDTMLHIDEIACGHIAVLTVQEVGHESQVGNRGEHSFNLLPKLSRWLPIFWVQRVCVGINGMIVLQRQELDNELLQFVNRNCI